MHTELPICLMHSLLSLLTYALPIYVTKTEGNTVKASFAERLAVFGPYWRKKAGRYSVHKFRDRIFRNIAHIQKQI